MTSATTPTQPADQPRPPVRPFLRSGTDRMAGGVCGGLAEYTGIDATLWRIGAVLFTLTGGAGVIVYLLMWVLVPSAPLPEGSRPSIVEQWAQRLRAVLVGDRGRNG
ncbi:PspC domain-containing protein [Blastococcus saxobsidens]|uniref:PspC domain-containing protein n=1 Tax=Blastococcus saxobsidens TaxID=138336 RepID=A0A6L9W6K7_9ACTN|nr:PspC domain-containing protein [Blastococcus saxobsidens]NEK87736.1 PspC domain-containing protein [Blastococcus saxobsidens]